MAGKWFCMIMGSEYGPMDEGELVERICLRNVSMEDLVRPDDGEWLAVFEYPELIAAANQESGELADEPEEQPKVGPSPGTKESNSDWFCLASGEKRGPLRFDQLQDLAKSGKLRARDRVWRASRPKFCPASDVDGLELN